MLTAALINFIYTTIVGGSAVGGAGYDTSRVGPSNAICERKLYNVTVSANNTVWTSLSSSINETVREQSFIDFIVSDVSTSSNFSAEYVANPATQVVTGTYSISGTLCAPKSGEKNASDVQMLVHGVGWDSSYWDFVVGDDESLSYVRASAAAGISTFAFDRLGTGLSEKPKDSYGVVQATTDVAIAQQLGLMLRDGSISSKGKKFSQVVGVGHSYGSIQVEALTAIAPNLFDGVMLTGFSVNGSALPLTLAGLAFTTATDVFPNRFSPSELSDGYLASTNPYTYQWAFLHYPGYTPATVARIQATEQPLTVGVMYTFTGLIQLAPNFAGAVHVVTGAKDFIFCLANCYAVPSGSNATSMLDFVQGLYPKVSPAKFSTYVPANTGHLVNQQDTAPQTYMNMLAFVESVLAT